MTTATTATTTANGGSAQTLTQLAGLDAILNFAGNGRQALANGDLNAAIANRRSVLQQLAAFKPDAEFASSVQALQAAESFSLHADTTCGLSCSSSINQHSTDLKEAFLSIFNPIAARYGTRTYAAGQI